jgi:GT2 family glycosyltransferase
VPEDAIHVVEERRSSAVNRNDGYRRTRRPFVCFLDDDIELVGDPTAELLEVMTATGADLASPKILDPQGRIFCADPYFDFESKPVPRGLGEPDRGQYDYVAEAPWLPSTMLMIRREVFAAVGGFDESYPGSQMEDVDFCLKARRRGFKCCYVGSARIVHFNQQRNDYFDENFKLFCRKWSGSVELFSRERSMTSEARLAAR